MPLDAGAALGPVALPAPSAELVEAEAATFVDTAGPGAAPQRLWSVAVARAEKDPTVGRS